MAFEPHGLEFIVPKTMMKDKMSFRIAFDAMIKNKFA